MDAGFVRTYSMSHNIRTGSAALLVVLLIFTRDAVLARVLAMALCLCLSQVVVVSKRLNELGWFLARELPSTYPALL